MNTLLPMAPSNPVRPVSVVRQATREMLFARTRAMAVAAGRTPLQITQRDYEQARLELTGESDMERQEAVLDASPGSPGRAQPVADWENEGRAMRPSHTREWSPAS